MAAALALPFAGPISQALLDREDAGLARLAILGLWTLTLYEYALTLLRLDERARAYFGITVANVLVDHSVHGLVDRGPGRARQRHPAGHLRDGGGVHGLDALAPAPRLSLVPDRGLLRRMLRFGLPTMPAELSLYSLNFIDRIILVRLAGLAEAGLYALAVKFAQGINVLARGIQLAWPPLAYSIQDDEEARRVYSVIFTWFAAVLAFGVTGLWLEARWIVRLLAAPEFFASYQAVGLLATGIALYALYLAMVVILGRTGRTEFSFPATIAAMATNIVLNLVLVPSHGHRRSGACAGRLLPGGPGADVCVHAAALPGSVRVAAPRAGRALRGGARRRRRGPASHLGVRRPRRAAPRVWLAYPAVLYAMGFLHEEERSRLVALLRPSAIAARARSLRDRRRRRRRLSGTPGLGPEVYEVAARDEDRAGT